MIHQWIRVDFRNSLQMGLCPNNNENQGIQI